MRVLMLGWEFPPFISGGLGTACYGLTKAMSTIGTDIIFVLPRPVTAPLSSHVEIAAPDPIAAEMAATADTVTKPVETTATSEDPSTIPVDTTRVPVDPSAIIQTPSRADMSQAADTSTTSGARDDKNTFHPSPATHAETGTTANGTFPSATPATPAATAVQMNGFENVRFRSVDAPWSIRTKARNRTKFHTLGRLSIHQRRKSLRHLLVFLHRTVLRRRGMVHRHRRAFLRPGGKVIRGPRHGAVNRRSRRRIPRHHRPRPAPLAIIMAPTFSPKYSVTPRSPPRSPDRKPLRWSMPTTG